MVGLMPSVDRQQHIFQAGKICQLLVTWGCSLSLEKEGLRITRSIHKTSLAVHVSEEGKRTVCAAPWVWRWGLRSRWWSAGCHPSLWGLHIDRRCVWPLLAALWCSPPPQDRRSDQTARPKKMHIYGLVLIWWDESVQKLYKRASRMGKGH